MNPFKNKLPSQPQKAKDPSEVIHLIAERLRHNRQLTKRPGDDDSDWAKAERISKSHVRRVLFRLNQPLIQAEKGVIEPVANWIDHADLFRIVEKLSPTLEALGVIAIPLVLFFATQSYQESLRQQELERAQQQAVTDYFNQLSTILLDLDGSLSDPQNSELRTLTRATTLTLLRDPNLDGARKGQVIGFLSQMNLVQREFVYEEPRRSEETIPVISLTNADLTNANLINADLTNANLINADLGDADLTDADLINANLTNANLTNANLRSTNLYDADLRGTNLSDAIISGFVNFRSADLSDINLSDINLRGADLGDANLSSADLRGADLRYIGGADLSFADLSFADLSFADLCDANLTNADLTNADLTNANLTNANLTNANLTNANLRGAILFDADLSTAATSLTQSQLEDTLLCGTRFPAGINLDPDQDCDRTFLPACL